MTRITQLGVSLALACGSSALAGEEKTHQYEASAVFQANYKPSINTLFYVERFIGTWYAKPLVDDGQQPLELLPFLQHPTTFSATLSLRSLFELSGTLYPWQNTGITASMAGSVGLETLGAFATANVGVVHYFSPEVRLEVLYWSERFNEAVESTATEIETERELLDGGQVNVFYLLNKWLLLSGSVELGVTRVGELKLETTSAGLETTDEQGLKWALTASATAYLGRQTSVLLSANVSDHPHTAVSSVAGSTVTTTTRTTDLRPSLTVGVQRFFTDSLYLRFNYKAQLVQSSVDGVAAPLQNEHQVFLRLGSYL